MALVKKLKVKCISEPYDPNHKLKNEDKDICVAEAIVDYIPGGGASLPDINPFNRNIWLSGDDGYNMRYIRYLNDGRLEYFYNDIIDVSKGAVHLEKVIRGQKMSFDFELVTVED